MTSITDIPISVIRDFLLQNNREIFGSDDTLYSLAQYLILNSKVDYYPDTVIDWIIAYNFTLSGQHLKIYRSAEIDAMSNKELNNLAVKLELDNNDKQSIINVLSYLHKLEALQLLPDEIKFVELLPKLGLQAFLSFCATDIKHRNLCNNDVFWEYLFKKDYGGDKLINKSYKDNFILAYQAEKLYKDLNLNLYFSMVPKPVRTNRIRLFLKIKDLDLRNKKLTSLPKEIGLLTKLKRLTLIGNSLKELPKEIGNLVNLTYLDLRDNKLISLPISLGKLIDLNFLFLSNNLLTGLLTEIGNLVNLHTLHIDGNKITYLPREMLKLKNLKYFRYDERYLKDKQLLSNLRDITDKNQKYTGELIEY